MSKKKWQTSEYTHWTNNAHTEFMPQKPKSGQLAKQSEIKYCNEREDV